MLVLDILREVGSPIDAVEQCRDIRQILLLEGAAILLWIFIEVLLVELRLLISWLDAVFSIDRDDIDSSSVDGVIFGLNNLIELCLLDKSNRQVLQDLQTTLSGPSSSCYGEDHRR